MGAISKHNHSCTCLSMIYYIHCTWTIGNKRYGKNVLYRIKDLIGEST